MKAVKILTLTTLLPIICYTIFLTVKSFISWQQQPVFESVNNAATKSNGFLLQGGILTFVTLVLIATFVLVLVKLLKSKKIK